MKGIILYMGLWIRSQNKEKIIECNRLEIQEVGNNASFIIRANDVAVGEYSALWVAKKVMDKIENAICKTGINEIKRAGAYYEYIYPLQVLFQMPEGKDVK